MTAQLISTIVGSWLVGWLVPEFIFILSGGKTDIPYGVNVISSLGFAALAYGLRG